TGRDVMIAALLGAEEYGFATAPLVVSGCIMMRVCHLDTCPVGIATQNPELRKRFSGKPEFVETFFEYIAEEVRMLLAELGFRTLDEAIGHAELLRTGEAIDHWKAKGLDLSPIFVDAAPEEGQERRMVRKQDHGLEKTLDTRLIAETSLALSGVEPFRGRYLIRNTNRSVGTMLGSELTRRHGAAGLPDDWISLDFEGSAGQSFGAFLPKGISLRLIGDANDYVGKGLSGGRIAVTPSENARFRPEENVIAGNVLLYGATSGTLFIRGIVGERFAVRNSGAHAVVEGVGDHGCEYMTGGLVVVIGGIGRNFAAGMSGGIAYLLGTPQELAIRINTEMVDIDPLDEDDADIVRMLLRDHQAATGSTVAADLLARGDHVRSAFVKIFPRDFKAALVREAERAELIGGTNG
ncbi:MAG: glutamate synthase-related protein, partial [Acidimicrobiales bacterium]